MKKRMLAALLAGLMVVSLVACGGSNDENASDGSKITVDGNHLDAEQYYNTYLSSDPTTLDSVKGNDTYSWSILLNIMEPLTRLDEEDGENVRVPAGAESWESNEDGTVWTFHLIDNTWSDGEPVTAADYVYGIQRTLDPEAGSVNSYLITCIKNGAAVNNGEMPVDQLGVRAVDDKTLEITLEQPTPYFLSLTDTRAMLPQRQDIVEQYGDTYGAEASNIVCNGPFKIDSWTHNSEIVVTQNENYWDADNVHLDKVTWQIIQEETTVFNSFDSGSLDTCSSGTPEWIERFSSKDGVESYEYENTTVRYHFYNTQDELFQNENIRKAFTYAIDREDVNTTIYFDIHKPSYSWVMGPVTTGENGFYREQVGENPLQDILKGQDPKELLLKGMEELGLGDDPSTLNVTLSVGGTTQWLRTYGEYFQQKFKEVLGVNIELEQNEWGTFQSKTNSGDYQMGYMSWTIDYNDPISMLEIMKSDAGSIPTFWQNEEYDSLINQASKEMDESARTELYKQAEEILLEECPVCPVTNEVYHGFVYSYVKNVATTPFNTMGMKKVYTSGR